MQVTSIILEAVIAVLFFLSALKGRSYLFGLTITFGIYVYYDLARQLGWGTSEQWLEILFFIATVSALYSAWRIYRR